MNNFLQITLVGCAALVMGIANAAERTVGTSHDFKGPVGLQLYSLRADFAKDVPGTLDKVRDFGFKYVEIAGTYNLPPEKYKQMLEARGLKPIGNHFSFDQLLNNLDGAVSEAKALGLPY